MDLRKPRRRFRKNIMFDLQAKEVFDCCDHLRRNMRIVRKLVCQDGAKYKRIWEKHSRTPIAFQGDKLYFDNYRNCFTCCGTNGLPRLLYKLPLCAPSQKIKDALMYDYTSRLNEIYYKNKGWRPSLLALTADNKLSRYDSETGELLQDVFLSSRYKFRHISCETDPNTLVVRSIHTKHTAMARAAGILQSLLMVLAVFHVFPLEFVGMMEIDKNIFGKDVSDAMIAHNVLVITHQNGMVRLYNFQHILEEYTCLHVKLGEPCEGVKGIVGNPGTGIPCSIRVRDCPPALFEVRCHSLQIGGFPWHYITSPHKTEDRDNFYVYCYHAEQLAVNGTLNFDSLSLEADKCTFHPDDSGRILHVGPNTLRMLCIKEKPSGKSKIEKSFEINILRKPKPCEIVRDGVVYSSSGRVIKKRTFETSTNPDVETIHSVNYESDMDLIGITAVQFLDDGIVGSVRFYDNLTGTFLKDIPFIETWDEFCDHTVCIELDTIVHIVRHTSNRFHCYVYRLDREIPQEAGHGNDAKDKSKIKSMARRRYLNEDDEYVQPVTRRAQQNTRNRMR